jgi:putative chitinase
MNPTEWLHILALGFFAGALGQGARAIVGFKKLNDSTDETTPASELVDGLRLLMSFGIGGVAGALAAIAMIKASGVDAMATLSAEQILGLAATGYSASDFIEGFIVKITPSPKPADTQPSTGSTQNSPDDAVG